MIMHPQKLELDHGDLEKRQAEDQTPRWSAAPRHEALGRIRGAVAAAHERHQRAHGNSKKSGDDRGRKSGAGGLGIGVSRRSLRVLHDARERQSSSELHRARRRHFSERRDDHARADEQISARSRSRRRPLAHVRGSQKSARVDSARRHARARPGSTSVCGKSGRGVSAFALHDVRLLSGSVSADQRFVGFRRDRPPSIKCVFSIYIRAEKCRRQSGSKP